MSNHCEFFGRIVRHLTLEGSKPAKALFYRIKGENKEEEGGESDEQDDLCTLVWWNPEERPAESSFVRVRGVWKPFKEKMELHVLQTEIAKHGVFDEIFSYYLQVLSISSRQGVVIQEGALCGMFAHPEPFLPLQLPAENPLALDQELFLGWPLVVEQPVFSLPIRLLQQDGGWLASQNGMLTVHEEALCLLGIPEKKAHEFSLRFSTLGETGIEQMQALRKLVGGDLAKDSVQPHMLDAQQQGKLINAGLLFSKQYSLAPPIQQLRALDDDALLSSFLGVYCGGRESKRVDLRSSFPIITPLNWEQYISVLSALSSELTVVTGPPGTGKSQVLCATAAAALLRNERVLIATNNNQSLDVLFAKMRSHNPYCMPIRLGRKDIWSHTAQELQLWRTLNKERTQHPIQISYELIQERLMSLFSYSSLDERKQGLQKILPVATSWGAYLWERYWRKHTIDPDLDSALLRQGSLDDVLFSSEARLLGTTISSASLLPKERGCFDLVIVDEASQCDVISVLPLLFRAKRVMVIGDEKQLAPVFGMDVDMDEQLGENVPPSLRYTRSSLFSRCAKLSTPILLTEHHRSRPEIISLSNHLFYGEQLTPMRRDKKGAVQWFPVSSVVQQEAEAKRIVAFVEKYQQEWRAKNYSIGIVTPFRAQVERLQKEISHSFVRIDTAHRFQGEECDVIILSLCVSASLSSQQWTFVEAPALLNVAITRAKERLVIMGNREECTKRGGLLARFASLVP